MATRSRHARRHSRARKQESQTYNRNERRDFATIARQSLPNVSIYSPSSNYIPPRYYNARFRDLSYIQDRREFNFGERYPVRDVYGSFPSYHVPTYTPRKRISRTSGGLSPLIRYDDPNRVLTCLRRKRRKETLFALGVGGSRTRKPKNFSKQNVRC
ncbi:hypothetical protein [Apis mellifera associated microvirus 53]|nr:hypothetical protein [Apis mellifera associated microvirus 53]